MLQISHICKEYRTGGLVQKALDDVSLNLRDNEFVAILGPSGSGKTTLLNVIGGLDRYDSGDLVINGISTKKYKDRDWDSYRNHTIGFVFQSYNLIPHQTVLSNVELALTISGIGKSERRRRAAEALEQVGLGDQIHKKPNQMSGGQMQRVAIARALVNDPDILLADEPTGALDSDTSVQVMELLKEVAKDRLVVMVTHNPELAQEYATRIVKLRDGRIRSDSHPYVPSDTEMETPRYTNMGKSSMSFLTALNLSFHNLKTKKARTLLTSFAGSIGIIGIALILSLSTGVNAYIKSIEKETLSEYPLQIQKTGMDLTSMMAAGMGVSPDEEKGEVEVIDMVTDMFSSMDSNDLCSLKTYLEEGDSGIEAYTNAIEYSYSVTPQIYLQREDEVRQVHPDSSFAAMGLGSSTSSNSMMSSMMSTDVFYEMPEEKSLYEEQYEVKAGRWPRNEHECIVVLSSGGGISDYMLYTLGLRDYEELDTMVDQFVKEENVDIPAEMGEYSYEDLLGASFKMVNSADYYVYNSQYQIWKDKREDAGYMKNLVENGEDLKVVGVVQPSEDAKGTLLMMGVWYLPSLTEYVVEQAKTSDIVRQQLAAPDTDVFTNELFGEESQDEAFDMASLFTVDEEALKRAFGFDPNAIGNGLDIDFNFADAFQSAGNSLDLAGAIDFSQIEMAPAKLPQIDLTELIQGLEIEVTPERLEDLAEKLMAGYQEYVKEQTGANQPGLEESFQDFLASGQGQKIITDFMNNLIDSGEEITADALDELAGLLMDGYREYCRENGFKDPAQMQEYLVEYLATSEARQILIDGLGEMLDLDEIENRLMSALEQYLQQIMASYMGAAAEGLQEKIGAGMEQMMTALASGMEGAMRQAMTQIGNSLQNVMNIDADAFAEAFQMNMSAEELSELMMSMGMTEDATYDGNLQKLGYADFDKPSEIAIYPVDFESKEKIIEILDTYNEKMETSGEEDKVITYTDMVGALMSSVTDIIDTISYVLIAFVAISLIVSSIMIGVITYISVLERKKEIGILRAIGASKRNISQVFNAETVIIGFCAGLIGIGLTLLALLPGNALIHHLADSKEVSAFLPVVPAVVLILLSVCLTLIGGLIPSGKAAKSDPVTALRTE